VNRAEKMFGDGSFGEREEQSFIDWIRGALGSGIELANGLGFVAEELDAEGAVGFGRVDVENAAAKGVLAGHFNYISRCVADSVEVGEEGIEVEGLAAADDAGKAGVVIAGAQTDGSGGDRRDDDGCGTGGNLPQGGGAFFLELGVRRKILERENVASGKSDDGFGIAGGSEFAESTEDREEVFDGAVVVDDEDERASGGALERARAAGLLRWARGLRHECAPCPP
jgi:hypothetical protein